MVATKQVPKKWKEHVEIVSRKKDLLSSEYSGLTGFEYVAIRSSSDYGTIGDRSKFVIVVGVNNERTFALSSDLDGTPIITEEASETMKPVCHNGGDIDDVNGE